MADGRTSCSTGRMRYGDRITASLARSRTTGGNRAADDQAGPHRCDECNGWHVPMAIPVQRTVSRPATVGR